MTTTIAVFHGSLTEFEADVIVHAANGSLLSDSGEEGAVHRVGGPAIIAEIQRIREVKLTDGLAPGEVVSTNAGNLPAKWVVHTVAPAFDDDNVDTLRSCYIESVDLADKLGAFTIALPILGLGVHGWPIADAVRHAVEGVASTDSHLTLATFVVESDEVYAELTRKVEARVGEGHAEA